MRSAGFLFAVPALLAASLALVLHDTRPASAAPWGTGSDDPVLLVDVTYEAGDPLPASVLDRTPAVPSSSGAAYDAILASPMMQHPGFLSEVQRWVHFFETRSTRWFPGYLERMTWFEDHVDDVLSQRGLPWSLRYLPVLESGYSPTAVSSAEAVGLWQFMAPTARDFGMRIDAVVDERRDPFKATDAAARFLGQLYGDFDSWFLALASYNAGPHRIRGILQRHAPGRATSDRLYWDVRQHLPQETRDFVPKFVAAMVIASDPEAHGYRTPPKQPFAFDRIRVEPGTRLSTVARAVGSSSAEIDRLNPEYLRGRTPSGGVTYVRVPVGSGEAVQGRSARGRRGDGTQP